MKIEGTFPKYKIEFEGDEFDGEESICEIDFSKAKDYDPEWQSEVHDLSPTELLTTGKNGNVRTTYMKHVNVYKERSDYQVLSLMK